jgi:hypothetical protein
MAGHGALVALLVIVGAGFELVYLRSGDTFVPVASLVALAGGSLSAGLSYYGARAPCWRQAARRPWRRWRRWRAASRS